MKLSQRKMLKGLYAITDQVLTPYSNGKIFELVELALRNGAKILQLRDKTTPTETLLPISQELKLLCHDYDALFIINDRLDLAKEVKADGVHIGKEDISLEVAKAEFTKGIIGVSCYGDLSRAQRAEALGADYVAFGSFYPSPTKPQSEVISKDILRKAKEILKIPICAIGGITLERAEELITLGADMLAVVSDLWCHTSVEARARAYREIFERYGLRQEYD